MTDTQNQNQPSEAVRCGDLLCDGVEAETLFDALHRQRMACGGYEVTGNPITVKLSPAVNLPSDGTRSHSSILSDNSAALSPNERATK